MIRYGEKQPFMVLYKGSRKESVKRINKGVSRLRKYSQSHTVISHDIAQVFCNVCGKEIPKNTNGYFMDHVHIEKQWGYFSESDGEIHTMDICEACFIKIAEAFVLPMEGKI